MKIVVELPTWLGDAVMASEALSHICNEADEIVLIGSPVAIQALKNYPKVSQTFIIDKKRKLTSLLRLRRIKADLAISFRSHLFSKVLTHFIASQSFTYDKRRYSGHQVEMYHHYIEEVFQKRFPLNKPKLYTTPKTFKKPTIGINPGATYGSAKRWYPQYFAQVIEELGKGYDFIIFGSEEERAIAQDIEKRVSFDLYNLAGKTSIEELIASIAGLTAFITNDSGPMHIAAAFDIPTVALFGPTDHTKTAPYSKKAQIVSLNLECAPCMKRSCPLKHHQCMKDLSPQMVLERLERLL